MNARATEAIFLPGFDGAAHLRDELVTTLAHRRPTRSIGYPNRALGTLDGYWQYVASQVVADSRPVVIAESFSGLVAAHWAAKDSRVIGLVLCGAFARNPVPFLPSLGAFVPSMAKFMGSKLLGHFLRIHRDTPQHRWSRALPAALGALHHEVIGERLRIIARENAGPALSTLRIPITLIQFEGDLVIRRPAQRHLESVCHNAQVMRLAGPHFALETRPLECARAIAACIDPFFEDVAQDE